MPFLLPSPPLRGRGVGGGGVADKRQAPAVSRKPPHPRSGGEGRKPCVSTVAHAARLLAVLGPGRSGRLPRQRRAGAGGGGGRGIAGTVGRPRERNARLGV